MTDNEKAATFIEWQCPVAKGLGYAAAGAPAPDMSKPENYMRALEGRRWLRDLSGQWKITTDTPNAPLPYWMVSARTPLEALAALYDAEHGS